MNLDDFIITCFCTIDELLTTVTQGKRLRQRGPQPKLADSEVITMELVATYLGLSQDQEVFTYFRCHYAHFFPAIVSVDRTTFVRQAANLWAVKERLWCLIRDSLSMIQRWRSWTACRYRFANLLALTAVAGSMTRPAMAKIIPVGRPSMAFACTSGCAGQE